MALKPSLTAIDAADDGANDETIDGVEVGEKNTKRGGSVNSIAVDG